MKCTFHLIAGLGVGALVVATVACKSDGGATGSSSAAATGSNSTSASPAQTPDPSELTVGQEIVASTAPHSFRPGKVTGIDGSKITFELSGPNTKTNKRSTFTVGREKVFLPGVPPNPAPKVGDFVIAKTSSGSWTGCEVKSANGAAFGCEDYYGRTTDADVRGVIVPDAATSADIRQFLAKGAKYRVFNDAAKAAGRPAVPKDWKPKVNDAVVLLFGPHPPYYGGTVEKVEGEKVTIKWDSPNQKNRATKSTSDVTPLPKAPATVKVGDFILVPPKSGNFAWDYRKVERVTKNTAEVIDKDDKKSTVNLKDVLAIKP